MRAAGGILNPRGFSVAHFANHHAIRKGDLEKSFVRRFTENLDRRKTGSVLGLIDALHVARSEAGPHAAASADSFKLLQKILCTGQGWRARIHFRDCTYRRDGRGRGRRILRRQVSRKTDSGDSRGSEGGGPAVYDFPQ